MIQMGGGVTEFLRVWMWGHWPQCVETFNRKLVGVFSGLMINLISVLPSSLSHSLPEIVMLSFFSLPSFAAQLSLLMSPLLLPGLLTMAECDALMRLGKSLFFADLRCFFKFQIWCIACEWVISIHPRSNSRVHNVAENFHPHFWF